VFGLRIDRTGRLWHLTMPYSRSAYIGIHWYAAPLYFRHVEPLRRREEAS